MSMQFGDPRLPQKFWARHEVTVNAGMSPCWTYTSYRGLGPNNRAIVRFGREKPTTNYRFTCDLVKGRLPEGLTCSHTCHNPLCANPEHIIYESIGDNIKRGTYMQHDRATEIFDAKRNSNPAFNRSVISYNKKHLTRVNNRYSTNPEYRNKQLKRVKDRYHTDPEHRAKHIAATSKRTMDRYNNDPVFREKQKAYARAYHAKKKANKTA